MTPQAAATAADLIPTLDHSSPLPLYHQISQHFVELIQNGTLQPGDQIPSERQLCDQTGVSRMTVRQAVGALISDGYCERFRGKGIFVRAQHIIVDSQRFEGFSVNVARQGLKARTQALGSQIVPAPEAVSDALDVPAGAEVVELRRLRLVNEQPAVLETEWFPAADFGQLVHEDMSQSLYGHLERLYGIQIASTVDVLRGYIPDDEECDILQLAPNTPVILRDRVGSTEDGTAIEVVRSVYHPEQYEFRMTLLPADERPELTPVSRP